MLIIKYNFFIFLTPTKCNGGADQFKATNIDFAKLITPVQIQGSATNNLIYNFLKSRTNENVLFNIRINC